MMISNTSDNEYFKAEQLLKAYNNIMTDGFQIKIEWKPCYGVIINKKGISRGTVQDISYENKIQKQSDEEEA